MWHLQVLWATCSSVLHPHSKELLSYIQPKPTLCYFKAILPCSITACPCKNSLPSLLVVPFRYGNAAIRAPGAFPPLGGTISTLSALSTGEVLQTSDHLLGRLDPLQHIHILLLEAQNWIHVSRWDLMRVQGEDHLPCPAGYGSLVAAQVALWPVNTCCISSSHPPMPPKPSPQGWSQPILNPCPACDCAWDCSDSHAEPCTC